MNMKMTYLSVLLRVMNYIFARSKRYKQNSDFLQSFRVCRRDKQHICFRTLNRSNTHGTHTIETGMLCYCRSGLSRVCLRMRAHVCIINNLSARIFFVVSENVCLILQNLFANIFLGLWGLFSAIGHWTEVAFWKCIWKSTVPLSALKAP